MSKRSRIILANSVLLAVLVIAGLCLNLLFTPQGRPLFFLYAGLALLSILSVPLVYFLKIRRKKHEKLLNEDYTRDYELVKDIMMQSTLPSHAKRDIINDLLDLLLTAQHSHKQIHDVITDAVEFAHAIIEACAKRKEPWWHHLPNSIIYFAAFVLGVQTLLWLEKTQDNWFAVQIDISMIIFLSVISFILVPVMQSGKMQKRLWIYFLPVASGFAFILSAELLRRFAYHLRAIRRLLDGAVQLIPNGWVLLIFLGIIPLMAILKLSLKKSAYHDQQNA